MLQEIRQQPTVLQRTLNAELARTNKLRKLFAGKKPRLVVLVARGTSDNAAQFARYLLEITTGIPVSLAAPSVFTLYEASVDMGDVLVVAISQSGESTDTNLVLEKAAAAGAMTIGITNEADSTLARIAEHAYLVRAGKEQSVAATKTYTGQLLTLYLLAYALGAPIDLDNLRRLPDWAAAALKLESHIAERVERFCYMDHAVVVARGLNYSNAFEFALKLMETCYVVAERFSSADLQHGPIAMVDAAFPVFMLAPSGVTWSGVAELVERLAKLKAEMMLVTDRSNKAAISLLGKQPTPPLLIPASISGQWAPCDLYTPIPYIIPGQLFAAHLAEVKGLDPDRPRTLNKITRTI
jgi:glucosamine--fructose-6-phosphate aminotransferase (isomerizing)